MPPTVRSNASSSLSPRPRRMHARLRRAQNDAIAAQDAARTANTDAAEARAAADAATRAAQHAEKRLRDALTSWRQADDRLAAAASVINDLRTRLADANTQLSKMKPNNKDNPNPEPNDPSSGSAYQILDAQLLDAQLARGSSLNTSVSDRDSSIATVANPLPDPRVRPEYRVPDQHTLNEELLAASRRATIAEADAMDAREAAKLAEARATEMARNFSLTKGSSKEVIDKRVQTASKMVIEADRRTIAVRRERDELQKKLIAAEQVTAKADERVARAEAQIGDARQRASASERANAVAGERLAEAEARAVQAEARATAAEIALSEADSLASELRAEVAAANERAIVAEEAAQATALRTKQLTETYQRNSNQGCTGGERSLIRTADSSVEITQAGWGAPGSLEAQLADANAEKLRANATSEALERRLHEVDARRLVAEAGREKAERERDEARGTLRMMASVSKYRMRMVPMQIAAARRAGESMQARAIEDLGSGSRETWVTANLDFERGVPARAGRLPVTCGAVITSCATVLGWMGEFFTQRFRTQQFHNIE